MVEISGALISILTYPTLLEKSSSVSNSCREKAWKWEWSKQRLLPMRSNSSR